MQIKELRLAGFKSFVDPVRVPIEAGLTGVVGPNGCGKSNLLESVRWVMGAASAKAMRADDMDDVIFAGSDKRPAREHAEVMLVLDNSGRTAPALFNEADELEVSRRIKRGAGSTYKVNGREARAKDVQLLFADASTGANSPALVRQGQISELIAAKPENRRRILEEAAGIGGLQARRHEADLKLKAADANLLRLDEVLAEIEGQAHSLKRQARQAERYRALADELRRVEALALYRRWQEAQAALAAAEAERRAATRAVADAAENASVAQRIVLEAQGRLGPLKEEALIAAAVQRKLEGQRIGLERDLAEAEAAIARLNAEAARAAQDRAREQGWAEDARAAVARLEAERAGLAAQDSGAEAIAAAQAKVAAAEAARAEAERRLEDAARAQAASAAHAQALNAAARDARGRLSRIEQRLAALMGERAGAALPAGFAERTAALKQAAEGAEAEAAKIRETLALAEQAAAEAEATEREAATPARAAENALRDLASEIRALERLAASAASPGKFPPALREIKVARGFERALAAALGDEAEASLDKAAPARWAGAEAEAPQWPAGIVPLAEKVSAPEALAARLAFCGVVEGDGASLIAALPPGARLVSKAGDLWRWDGFVRRAEAAQLGAAARLENANRLEALRADLAGAEEKQAAAQQVWTQARAARDAAEAALKAARAATPAAAQKAVEARAAEARHAAEAERLSLREAALGQQEAALRAELAEAAEAANAAEAALKAAPAEAAFAADLDAARKAAEPARAAAAEARAAYAALARERDARAQRLTAIEAELGQWRTRAEAAARRIAEIEAEAQKTAQALAQAQAAPQATRAALAQLADEAAAAETRRAAGADKLAAAETRVREAERGARTAEALHAQEREARAGAEARCEAGQARLNDVIAHVHEAAGIAPEALPARAGGLMSGPLAAGPLSDVERKADRLRAERDSGGPVNLRAEEELAETQARFDGLTAEKADVAGAIAKLRRAISDLNSEGRARLMDAFETVNGHFAALFAALFEGGHAELKLHEAEGANAGDPLAAGLEIYASPPGKRLSTLSLMSGGEQALTASALIFAVFLANPAPLCVLDEVDAPLDDANVDRFCRMLDEMRKRTDTRFLVITHNPMTMARMDRLYGVTMGERGVSQLVSVDLTRAAQLAAA